MFRFCSGRPTLLSAFLFTLIASGILPACAVTLSWTNDPSYNTTAPTGSLAGSGWQWQGYWGSYLGTAIAPRYFLAAQHIGGNIGDGFSLNGVEFHTIAFYDLPNSDLRIWKIAETFANYAPLYINTNETGRSLVVFGRGTQRGEEIIVNSQLKGWRWGTGDGVLRWGENIVTSLEDYDSVSNSLLKVEFNRNSLTNEAHLSVGDSSGAVFIQESNTWKLAGINYLVDGPFSLNGTTNTQFDATLLDMGGLYTGSGTNWTFIEDTTTDKPSAFYATRVSRFADWIQSVIDYQVGTDFWLQAVRTSPDNVTLRFLAASNRLYRIQYSSNLQTNGWQYLTDALTGTGQVMEVQDPAPQTEPRRFYRLQLLR